MLAFACVKDSQFWTRAIFKKAKAAKIRSIWSPCFFLTFISETFYHKEEDYVRNIYNLEDIFDTETIHKLNDKCGPNFIS
jgi:hypothetical protein